MEKTKHEEKVSQVKEAARKAAKAAATEAKVRAVKEARLRRMEELLWTEERSRAEQGNMSALLTDVKMMDITMWPETSEGELVLPESPFERYSLKWIVLQVFDLTDPPFDLPFRCFPWPVLESVRSLDDINEMRIREFIFHPDRQDKVGRTKRNIILTELMRWDLEKIQGKIIDRILQEDRNMVWDGVEIVMRTLMEMKDEE